MFRTRFATLILVIAICCVAPMAGLCATTSHADLIRFLPTLITVTYDSVIVDGYFVNMNNDCSVSNFDDVDLSIYIEDELLVEGNFGRINSFRVYPNSSYFQRFTFNRPGGLNTGKYVCNESCYALMDCSFKSRDE